jgi:ferredoxin
VPAVKIEILQPKCQAYGNCADEAPELFQLDDGGYGDVIGDGEVADRDVSAAKRAILSCPASAITARD